MSSSSSVCRLEILGLLVSALRPVRQRVLCLLQDALGLGEIAEACLGPRLFEPRKQPQALGLFGKFSRQPLSSRLCLGVLANPIEGLAKIDAHAIGFELRQGQRKFRVVLRRRSGKSPEQPRDTAEALRLELDAPQLGDDLGDLDSIVLKTSEGESGKQLARRLAIVAAPSVHDCRLAPNLDQLVEIRGRRRFGLCLCLCEMLQRLAVELPPVRHDSHQPMHARLMLRIVRERRQDGFQPRLEVREIPAFSARPRLRSRRDRP